MVSSMLLEFNLARQEAVWEFTWSATGDEVSGLKKLNHYPHCKR